MTPRRHAAVVRGFSAASLATFAALAGHVTGGGQMPGPLGIIVPWVLSFMVSVLLAGRKLSVTRLSISVAISQLLFHALFVLGTARPSAGAAGHVHGAPLTLSGSAGITETVAADGMMWLGHALAAILTILVAHRGERLVLALCTLARQLALWVRRRLDAAVPAPALSKQHTYTFALVCTRTFESRIQATLRGRAPPVVVFA